MLIPRGQSRSTSTRRPSAASGASYTRLTRYLGCCVMGSITVEAMAEIADLESLPTKELHDRAVKLAARRGDIKFLWEQCR
ncbi:hypothetical protein NSERKGN1266_13260 [Nocardia seriolae]|nr:hypothetical protein NSERKGN1266_13260 [Nocardia seriolae]